MSGRLEAVLPARPEARRLLVGTLLSSIGHGMTLPFLFVYLTRIRHFGPTYVGLIVAWIGVLSLLLAGPGGALIDRYGVRRVLLPLYLVFATGTASFGFVHTVAEAFGAATLTAVGGAVIWAAQTTLLTTVTSDAERQRVFGLSFALLNLGIGIGGTVAGFLVDNHDPGSYRLLYLVDGLTTLAPAFILFRLRGIGGRLAKVDVGVAVGGYRDVLANLPFRRFLAFGLLVTVCGYAQLEIGLAAFATDVSHVSPRVIAWALAANTVTIVVLQLGVLRRLEGRSRSRSLAVVGAIIGSAWLILGVSGYADGGSRVVTVGGVILCPVIFACAETIMSPMMPAITNALATDELRGRYNAMGTMIFGTTAVAGPLTAAPLIGHGFGAVWVVLLVVGASAAALVALSLRRVLTPEQDGRRAPEKIVT